MKKTLRLFASLIGIVLFSGAAVAATPTGTLINRNVAIVNNTVITQQQLDEATQQHRAQIEQNGITPPANIVLQRQTLQHLILAKLATQLAQLNHITVTPEEVDQAIQTIAQRNHITVSKMASVMKGNGTSIEAYRQEIKQQIIMRKLEQQAVANRIMVTPSEIDNYLAERATQGNPDEQFQVQHILLALPEHPTAKDVADMRQKADHIVKRLHQGLSFKQAAVIYSQAGDAEQGGDLGWKTLNQLPAAFAKAVSKIQVGEVYGPIQTSGGFNIIKLVAKKNPEDAQHFISQYQVRQILIKTSPVLDDQMAQAQLKHVILALHNGQSFSDLAQAYNQDINTQQSDGDMGWISLAGLSPELAQQIKQAKLNQVTEPFQASDGWMIIEVTGKREKDNTQAFRRNQAAQALFQQKAAKAVATWQAKIRGEAYIKILVPELQPQDDLDS